ncbi:MAG: glycosyltransferase family 39 protein [Spirochaetaceae bacterium]|jgi:hypothetical protein|nr:glycosyltransferase family 39 protein [Spirochaetaceae bacterium]
MHIGKIFDETKMNKIIRIMLTIACILGAGISFFHILEGNQKVTEYPGVHVNIEIDKEYAGNPVIFLTRQQKLWWLSPTTAFWPDTGNVVLYTTFYPLRIIRGFSIRIPEHGAAETINAIDNISVFIGNKLFYFSQSDVKSWEEERRDGFVFLKFPDMRYSQSFVIKGWNNYYGDFDLALKGISDFLFHPGRYAPAYFFIFILLYLYRKSISSACAALSRKPERWKDAACLVILILAAFALRINGYVRHSGWTDEIYSATIAGHPFKPLIQTFTDSGNPPFYFMLLRFWFTLFGWTENAGTMLSVILGTLAVPALYAFVRPYFGRKTAFLTAFLLAICAFAIGYSQEMRAYILKIFLTPVIAFVFLRMLDKISFLNSASYVILSAVIVNSHYYGILLVISNFVFFVLYHCFSRPFKIKKFLYFLLANICAALSFLPFFLYQIFVKNYYFERERTEDFTELAVIFIIILCFAVSVLYFRTRIAKSRLFMDKSRLVFCSYIAFIPCAIFTLAFMISFIRPMISFRYIMPVNLVFFLCAFSVFVYMCVRHPKLKYFCVFLVWAFSSALSEMRHDGGGSASIPGGGTEAYKEAREYIAKDAAAHPEYKAAMLDNAPDIAAYYGYPDMPLYSPQGGFDILYVFNSIFIMHEPDMYEELLRHNIDDSNILKIRVNDETVIYKKYLN